MRKRQRAGAVQNLPDFPAAPAFAKRLGRAVALYRFFPSSSAFFKKYFKTRGVIGRRKTPWTGDTTNQALIA
jgi:hypothetical protein